MKTLRSLSMVAAMGLAGTVYAQAQTPPNPAQTQPSAASSQHQRDAMSTTRVAEGNTGDKYGAQLVGAKVQMSTGESLGEVKEVLLDKQGNASYAVIAHGSVMGVGGKRTAVPWATVKSSMRDDTVIMDRSQLEQAPVLASGKTPDASSGTWSHDADTYWRAKVSTRATSPVKGDKVGTMPSNPAAMPAPAKDRS